MSEFGLISLLGLPLLTLVCTAFPKLFPRIIPYSLLFRTISYCSLLLSWFFLMWLAMLCSLTETEKLSSLPGNKTEHQSRTKHCQTHCEARAASPFNQSICQSTNKYMEYMTNSSYCYYIWLLPVFWKWCYPECRRFCILENMWCIGIGEPCPMSHWAFVKVLQPRGSNPRSSWCSLPQWLWCPESASDAAIRSDRANHINPRILSKLASLGRLWNINCSAQTCGSLDLVSYRTTELLLPASFSRRSSKLGMSAGASSSSTSSKSSTSWNEHHMCTCDPGDRTIQPDTGTCKRHADACSMHA